MPSMPFRHPHEQLRDPRRNQGRPALRDAHDMQYRASFVARVREQVVYGSTPNEYRKVVALKSSNLASFLVLQSVSKAADGELKKSSAAVTQYPLSRCVKVTSWEDIEAHGSMAIHFENENDELGEQKQSHLGSGSKARPAKSGRTKVSTIAIRHWAIEAKEHVRALWMELSETIKERVREQKPRKKSKAERKEASLGPSVIDPRIRMKERMRGSASYTSAKSAPRPSGGRLSQGQKIQRALKRGEPQKGGRYSALSRGATGGQSFSKSLIGSPNLNGFDEKPKPKRPEPTSESSRRIEQELAKRAQIRAHSQASSTPTQVHAPDSHKGSPNSSSSSGELVSRKRRRSIQHNPDDRVSRQKYLAGNLALHRRATSQASAPRRRLRHAVLPLRRPRLSSPDPPISSRAGIFNEGNTCYLSAVVQALMCDADLISVLGGRIVPNSVTMPFSNALSSMANNRESSTTLKAGEIRKAISEHFPQFSSSDQQDAHEFLLRCFDVIVKECSWAEFWESPTHTNYSLVQERSVRCISCGHSSDPRRETLRGLSLDIPSDTSDGCSVEDLTRAFFAPHDVDLNCERCEGQKARTESKVVLAPRSLVLHIKRFGVDYDPSNGDVEFRKISDAVRVPEEISLDSVLAPDAVTLGTRGECATLSKSGGYQRKVTPLRIDEDMDLFSNPGSPHAGLMSPPPLKSQPFSQMTQLLSPKEAHGNSAKQPPVAGTGVDIARRFRVYADHDEALGMGKDSSTGPSVRRRLDLDVEGDTIEEYQGLTQGAGTERIPAKQAELVKVVMQLGVRQKDAEDIVKKANYDHTRAVGLAMDKLQEVREMRGDLDDALVNHSWARSKALQGDAKMGAAGRRYKLAAVIRHNSKSIERGHYVADVRQDDGTWFCYDDSRVSKLGSRADQDSNGYLCWYICE